MTDPKPCGCPDTLQTPMTVAELRGLLAEYPGDTPVFVGGEDEFGEYYRPNPGRVRVRRELLVAYPPAWVEDDDDTDPNALEGICL